MVISMQRRKHRERKVHMFVRRAIHSWSHLSRSVASQYGEGLRGYCKFIYYSCLRVNTFGVFAKDITDVAEPEPLGGVYSFQEMTPADLDRYRRQRVLPKEFHADGLDGVSKCHVVLHGDAVAYIHWVYQSGEKSRFLSIGPDVAEINHIVTLPAFRRKQICSWALAMAFKRLADIGIKKVVAVVHSDNIASRRAMEHAGMEEETVIRTIGPFNNRLTVQARQGE